MSYFYQKFLILCHQNNDTPSNVIKELGMSASNLTNWREGSIPKSDTVQKIASRFHVTTDYLLSEHYDVQSRPLSDREIYVLELFDQLDERGQVRYIQKLEDSVYESDKYYNLAKHLFQAGVTDFEIEKWLKSLK